MAIRAPPKKNEKGMSRRHWLDWESAVPPWFGPVTKVYTKDPNHQPEVLYNTQN